MAALQFHFVKIPIVYYLTSARDTLLSRRRRERQYKMDGNDHSAGLALHVTGRYCLIETRIYAPRRGVYK